MEKPDKSIQEYFKKNPEKAIEIAESIVKDQKEKRKDQGWGGSEYVTSDASPHRQEQSFQLIVLILIILGIISLINFVWNLFN